MAIVRTDDTHYKNIANAIRNELGINEVIKPEDMAFLVQIVDDNGWQKGYNEGYGIGETTGIEQGKQAQYDEFWDVLQDNGNRTNYTHAFSFVKWNADNFKPKYTIKPTKASNLFNMAGRIVEEERVDLIALEEETNIKLDFSDCTNLSYAFADGGCIKAIGEVDVRKCTDSGGLSYAFYGGYGTVLETIKKIICDENSIFNSTTFNYLGSLIEIRFEGVIGKSGITFALSTKLSHESLISIINALKDLSGTTTTMSIALGTANLAKLTDAEKAIAIERGWTLA